MGLPHQLQSLLEHAQAEAKRTGHEHAGALHLLLALQRRSTEAVNKALGADAGKRIAAAMRAQQPNVGPTALAVLEQAAKDDANEEALLALLQPHLDQLTPPGPNAGEGTAATGAQTSKRPPTTPDHLRRHEGLLEEVHPRDDVHGRDEITHRLVAILGQRTPGTPCLVGPPGCGRTSILAALAAAIEAGDVPVGLQGKPVYRLVPEACLARGRTAAVRRVLDGLEGAVLAIDDLEVIAALGGHGADIGLLGTIRSAIGHPAVPLVLTIAEPFNSRLKGHDAELDGEIVYLPVDPLTGEDLQAAAADHGRELAEHHGVAIPDPVLLAAAAPGVPGERAHPGLLVDRLDHSGTVAALREDRTAQVEDLGLAGAAVPRGQMSDLGERLRTRVQGQDQAIAVVASRLALTRKRLDLRPERPDGVFLFAGPTGVGKTALARALCMELFGDQERLIRLDMSEFMHDWAVSRITGPAPGYVGSTEPDEWLTTKVRNQPDSLILLDEVEKAHPRVWTAFLQVFDAGRLSDLHGTVSFADTIVVMTTNLGAASQQGTPVGFTSDAADVAAAAARADAHIRAAMPPELINRLDGVLVFHPLGPRVIRDIAAAEVASTIDRLAGRGYDLAVAEDVIELIAERGYDPRYGARHLQRNIEKLLLEPLVTLPAGRLRAQISDAGTVEIVPTGEG